MGNNGFLSMWETLVDLSIATDEELSLVTSLCGNTIEILNDVLYIRTGYRSIDQLLGVDMQINSMIMNTIFKI